MKHSKRTLFVSLLSTFLLTGCLDIPIKPYNPDIPPSGEYEEITILATNDIHGQIYESEDEGRMGIGMLMTYLKNRKDNEKNVFLLDQGDTWQGSIYSNYNHGACITDVMNYVHYDARTVGNHDFDWGLDPVKTNKNKEYGGYKTPVLAANIYDYDFVHKVVGTHQQSELGQPSVTYTTESGTKIGIVGTIGSNQITSISTNHVQDIIFTDHVEAIKNEARKLKNDGCDIIIASIHAGQEEVTNRGLNEYVDAVLCAHTHKLEDTVDNQGLRFFQYQAYTTNVGELKIRYYKDTDEVHLASDRTISYSTVKRATPTIEPTISEIISEYASEVSGLDDQIVACHVADNFSSGDDAPNLMAKAIYDTAWLEGYEVDLSYVNQARRALYSGEWTYADIYQSFPFDNTVYIMDISADEYMREIIPYNSSYHGESRLEINPNKTYKVACLDYLALHTNASRHYDYFPSMEGVDISTLPTLSKTYREILVDWLKNNNYDTDYNKTLTRNDYRRRDAFDPSDVDYAKFTITYNDNYSGGLVQNISYNYYSEFYFVMFTPIRDGYTFLGWYFDSDCTSKCYNFKLLDNIEVFAKWTESVGDIYTTGELDYTVFETGSTQTSAYATNINGSEQVLVEFDTSPIEDDSAYNEFKLPSGGYIHLLAPTGYKIYSFKVDQYKYHNLAFYRSNLPSEDRRIECGYETIDSTHTIYELDGLSETELMICNTYTSSISLRYVQISFVKA